MRDGPAPAISEGIAMGIFRINGRRPRFMLPPEGALTANDPRDDPLPYYYHPIWGRMYRNRLERGLELLNPPYRRILEIGYGSGIAMPTLCGMGSEVWGVDPVSDPQKVGAGLGGLGIRPRLIRADIRDWDAGAVKFDLIVAFSVLEHIESPGPVLQRIAGWLEPGGGLLIGMPRVGRLMVPLFNLIGYRGIENHHVTSWREVRRFLPAQLTLACIRSFPRIFPRFAALYYNLLVKNEAPPPAGAGRAEPHR
jgi:SAM-dependent methyltransferase